MPSRHRIARPFFSLTHHAVERFIERFRPDLGKTEAFDLLRREARAATYFGKARERGDLWRVAALDLLLVVVHHDCSPGVVAVTTVIPVAKSGSLKPIEDGGASVIDVTEAARRAGAFDERRIKKMSLWDLPEAKFPHFDAIEVDGLVVITAVAADDVDRCIALVNRGAAWGLCRWIFGAPAFEWLADERTGRNRIDRHLKAIGAAPVSRGN